MKTIVAGSRDIDDAPFVMKACEEAPWEITEIVSGRARGVDRNGEDVARRVGIPVQPFPANWAKYGNAAGPIRNGEMERYADALVAIWDGKSTGTADMIGKMRAAGKPVHVALYTRPAKVAA